MVGDGCEATPCAVSRNHEFTAYKLHGRSADGGGEIATRGMTVRDKTGGRFVIENDHFAEVLLVFDPYNADVWIRRPLGGRFEPAIPPTIKCKAFQRFHSSSTASLPFEP